MIKSDDLTDELSTLWHQLRMNLLVHFLKSVTECLLNVADTMELGVMWSHHSAVIANVLLIVVTVVS